jgi:SSS family solute:Na+ symporter
MIEPLNLWIFVPMAACFLALLLFLAWLGYRKTKNEEDFLVAGRQVPPWLMAISYSSVFISSASIMGFGGNGSKFGLGVFWIVTINLGLGLLLAYLVFGPRIRKLGLKLNASTMPELLGNRFKSKFIQVFAGSVTFLFMPIYAGAVLVGVGRLMEMTLGIGFVWAIVFYSLFIALYVVVGGLKGMVYADAALGILKFTGMAILGVMMFVKAGSFSAVSNLASVPVPENLAANGIVSFTKMPETFSNFWWLLVTSILGGVAFGILAQPQLSVRFMTLKSNLDIKRAIGFSAIFILVANGAGILAGAFSNVVTMKTIGSITYEAYTVSGNADKVIPFVVNMLKIPWFEYLLLFTLMTASISAVNALTHTMSTSLGHDIIESFRNRNGGSVGLIRICAVASLVFIIIVSLMLPKDIIPIATAIFFGIAGATFLPAIIGAIFWNRTTKTAVIASMITGFSTIMFLFVFVHQREAEGLGICKMITGQPCVASGSWLSKLDPSFIAVPLSMLVLVLVTLFTRKTDEESI